MILIESKIIRTQIICDDEDDIALRMQIQCHSQYAQQEDRFFHNLFFEVNLTAY